MSLPLWLPMVLALAGQAPAPAAGEPADDPAARLEFMKKSVTIYSVRPAGGGPEYRLDPEPVFRWNNPVSGSKDGAVFLWTEGGRPVATVQSFSLAKGGWLHEFSSLSTGLVVADLRGQAVWAPNRPGVEYRPVPGAPKPAESAAQRLRQMQAMAREFTADDSFKGKPWEPLRLLPKPLTRYGAPGSDVLDGALFCFALGTDPEVFLMLEARGGNDGPAWHYGLAPMTAYEVKVSHQGKPVWSLPWRPYPKDPTQPFCNRRYTPEG
jgi:hypothetical protein